LTTVENHEGNVEHLSTKLTSLKKQNLGAIKRRLFTKEMASKLQIGKGTVTNDLLYLKKQAQENLKNHIQEDLTYEYQKCMTGINQVLKMAWPIVSKDIDNKTKLDALRLINDCNKYKMDYVQMRE
jgi:LPS O-antigen subunit length determinant protein (WzzB/FepE family)